MLHPSYKGIELIQNAFVLNISNACYLCVVWTAKESFGLFWELLQTVVCICRHVIPHSLFALDISVVQGHRGVYN